MAGAEGGPAAAFAQQAVERLSREKSTGINRFVAAAVAEKISVLQTASYFADRGEPEPISRLPIT